jgi:TetR/AcrR family fatty acid metabolism transcriptional regulator
MSTTKSKKDVLQEFRKSELLSAARIVFSRKGFHDATIDDLAQEAGVAKGTVYLYFKSKQEIYVEALRDGVAQLIEEMRTEAELPGSAADRLRRVLTAKIAFFDKHRDFFQILQSELGHIEKNIAECKDLYVEQGRIFESILRDGIREGSVQEVNTKKTAFAIADLTRGVAIQRLLGWSKTRLNEEVEFLFSLLWKGIGQ